MSQKQLKRLKVMNAYVDGHIDRKRAAELLSISERQVSRLKKGLIKEGETSLIHKNIGRKPVHAISSEMKEIILGIHNHPEFKNVNFLHFKDILATDKYNIRISYSALSSILKSAGNESPKKKKTTKRSKNRRKRRACEGELLQIDSTPYEWFSSDTKYALHGAIDDATGNVVGLYMSEHECLNGYFEVMRQCVLNHGVPGSIYSDNHTIFRSPKTGKLSVEEVINGKTVNLTQFGRAMHELGTDIIFAKTSWAKGRIERLWDTLQSRLPVELAMRNITTIEAANRFLSEEYIKLFNRKFSIPAEGGSIFVTLRDGIDIDNYLCIKQSRKTDAASVFSFSGSCFQILSEGYPIVPEKKEIEVLISPRYGIRVCYKNHIFNAIEYVRSVRKDGSKKVTKKIKKSTKPYLTHGSDAWKMIWHGEDYELSMKFLYELFLDKLA